MHHDVIEIKKRCRHFIYFYISVALTCFVISEGLGIHKNDSFNRLHTEDQDVISPLEWRTTSTTARPLMLVTKVTPTLETTPSNKSETIKTTEAIKSIALSYVTKIYNTTFEPFHRNATKKPEPCELPSISEFPGDVFTQSQRRHGGLILHLIVALYMFVGLAIVCDYYFVSSLEVIVYKLNLQADVAGASLMAIGSSAPELFASLIGVFITKGDIGIGTILGSAVFNVLFVLGLCGIVASADLILTWWPITRDALCYAFTLIVLTVSIFDGEVTWKESAFLLFMYIAYLALMWYNERIEKWFYKLIDDKKSYALRFEKREEDHDNAEEERLQEEFLQNTPQYDESDSNDTDEEAYPQETPRKLMNIPESDLGKIGWLVTLPVYTIFYITIPDIRRRECRGYVSLTFLMSILWIGFLTYTLIWMVTVIGYTLDIPDSVMGLTLIAFGSSVPDAFASLIVAKQGHGDMAVSQALGSNVFDILFGLGLPWLIKTLIFDLDSTIEVQSIGMLMSCFTIFVLVLGMLLGFYWKNFILSKKMGYALVIAYVLFLIISVLLEIFVWESYQLPTCKI